MASVSWRGAVDVVEAAYAVDRDDDAWLRGVAESASRMLDAGPGVHALRVDLARHDMVHDPLLVGGSRAWQKAWRQNWWEPFLSSFDREQLRFALGFGTVSYSSHLWEAGARNISTYRELFERLGSSGWGHAFSRFTDKRADGKLFYPESLNILALDASQRGLAILANREELASSPPDAATLETWTRVAGHIAAAVRLRARLAGPGAPAAEAIVSPSGKVEHAEGDARSRVALAALRDAVRQVDRARTERVRDQREALSLWQALHAGRWSLMDVFERDGRRYYVARENRPAPPAQAHLSRFTERERQVVSLLALGRANKAIAYELGLSMSTVATLVRRAMRRSGAESSAQLAAWARAQLVHSGAS